jgi:uncharacterized membrane protein
MMPEQQMSYERPGSSYGDFGDGGFGQAAPFSLSEQKLSVTASGLAPTTTQRLALALVSLGMLMGMTFGLVSIAVAAHEASWLIFPILCVLAVFSAVAVSINIVFNRAL